MVRFRYALQFLHQVVICNETYYGECVRHLNVRIREHIRIGSLLAKKKVKPKGSAVSDHLLRCNHYPFFEKLNVLTKENKNERKPANNER